MRPSRQDELLEKAIEVFYRDGFHATGMDRLVAETGISKTSMYKYFGNKEELILAVLRLRDQKFHDWFIQRTEELGSTPAEQLLATFDVLREWFAQPTYRSCLFIKASAEYPDADHPIHMQSAATKADLQSWLLGLATKASAKDAAGFARQLQLLHEGAIVTAHLGYTRDPAGDAKTAAQHLAAVYLA